MAEPLDPAVWRRTIRSRLLFISIALAFWVVAIEARLVYFQVYLHDYLTNEAEQQQERPVEVPARRGDILDRHGRILAYSVDADSVYAVPKEIASIPETIDAVCRALDGCSAQERASLQSEFRNKKRRWFAWVRRAVSVDQARRVAALKIKGIDLMKEPRRFYPNRELAANVLGYVGNDEQGLAGIEERYDRTVRGRPGKMLVQQDGRRHVFSQVGDAPVPGTTLELTIDENLQHIAESELRAGVEQERAEAGVALIMDPSNGEILAMANWPTFNPNDYQSAPDDARKNRAVQDVYEPGSTFKMITATAALEEKVMTPNRMIDTGNGVFTMPTGRTVRDTHAHGTIPFHEAIAVSSNIGAIKTGLELGAARFGKYVKEFFRFGTRLSPDFNGESAGLLYDPSTWKPYEALASVAMGYQISVTPLQMATAASAIANGGELVQPRIVRATINGNVRRLEPRKVIGRVASPQTLDTLTGILEEVVESGTAKATKVEGFTIAGKTGTSAKLVPDAAGRLQYSKRDYNASFVGFVPSRKPAMTIIVWIDAPHAGRTYGGVVAGPIFQRIAARALRYLAVPPNVNPAAPVMVRREVPNEVRVAGPAVPLTILPPAPLANGERVLPELRGLGGREALRVLTKMGLAPRISGDGIVLDQDPAPGTAVEQGASCRLVLGRAMPKEQAVKAGGERP